MSCLDFWAVDTSWGLASTEESLGATAKIRLSESAWLRIAVSSGRWVTWAAVRAICAEDKVSIGLDAELAVATALLRVEARTVWLTERLYRTNAPTTISSNTLPATTPKRISFRRAGLSSLAM